MALAGRHSLAPVRPLSRSAAQPRSARSTSRTSSCRRRSAAIDRRVQRRSGCSSPRSGSTSPRRSISSTTTGRPGSPAASGSAARARTPRRFRALRHGRRLPRLLRCDRKRLAAPGRRRSTSSSTSSAPSTTRRHTCATTATSATSSNDLMAAVAVRRRARGARARQRTRRLLRPPGILDRRAGLALPRAARLARPKRADGARRARRARTTGEAVVTFSWRASSDDVGPVVYLGLRGRALRRRGAANVRAAGRSGAATPSRTRVRARRMPSAT